MPKKKEKAPRSPERLPLYPTSSRTPDKSKTPDLGELLGSPNDGFGRNVSIDEDFFGEEPDVARAHTLVKHHCEGAFRRLSMLKVHWPLTHAQEVA